MGSPSKRPTPLSPARAALAEALQQSQLLADAGPDLAVRVAKYAKGSEYRAQATILHAGEPTRGIGVLLAGSATVREVDAATSEMIVVETLHPGDHFGEVGALLHAAQPLAIVAEETCRVAWVPLELVDALCDRVPRVGAALARRLATRIVQSSVAALRLRGGDAEAADAPASSLRPVSDGAPAIPFVLVSDFDPGPQLASLLPPQFVLQHQALPLALRGRKLTIGVVNPRHAPIADELKRVLANVDPEVVAISRDDFTLAVARLRIGVGRPRREAPGAAPASTSFSAGSATGSVDTVVFDQADAEREPENALRVIGDEVVLLVNRIVMTALDRDASDVHIEPDRDGVRVRFRIQGMLADWGEPLPSSFAKGVAARLKVLAGLDITDRRTPQDGRIGVRIGRREVDLRVSVLPSSRGETIVLRVLEAATMLRPLEQVFVESSLLGVVRRALERHAGAVVVAGPSASGKTATLYASLHDRRTTRPDSKILMVEDPIEYRLSGVTQVQVQPSAGIGFATVLRAMLRQDPDVIMVGDVRDAETAQIALEAAMTGHLLLTSIHANGALSVVQRLETMGCSRVQIAQSLSLVLVQRLARRLCPHCARLEAPAPVLLESLVARGLVAPSSNAPLPRPVGCDACQRTGFLGRVAVFETLQTTDELLGLLMAGRPLAEVQRAAIESRALVPFQRYAARLLAQKVLAPSEALMIVAD